MYYPQSYRPNEEEEEQELEALDVTLYDRIDSQWIALFETSLVLSTLSISTVVALLFRAFGFTPVTFAILGIAALAITILGLVNWNEFNQRTKTRLFLCLLAGTTATAIATIDSVVDWIKLNPVTANRIITTFTIVGTVIIALTLVMLVGRFKNARQK